MRIKLHEINGKIALKLGEHETIYLHTWDAEIVAQQLDDAATQIRNGYHFETVVIED